MANGTMSLVQIPQHELLPLFINAALVIALNDIIEARSSSVVRLTKLRASPKPVSPPGNWGEYKLGQSTNTTSLPVNYTLTGLLLVPPRIGGKVKVLRTTRNGIEVPGVFESTEVVEIGEDGFTTLNSDYLVKTISKEECRF